MEILNYSLWFVSIWWIFTIHVIVANRVKPTLKGLFITMIIMPTPVILLEYLIMR